MSINICMSCRPAGLLVGIIQNLWAGGAAKAKQRLVIGFGALLFAHFRRYVIRRDGCVGRMTHIGCFSYFFPDRPSPLPPSAAAGSPAEAPMGLVLVRMYVCNRERKEQESGRSPVSTNGKRDSPLPRPGACLTYYLQ